MRASVLLLLTSALASAQSIDLANRVASFTNLDGTVHKAVTLVKADLDGIIWRDRDAAGRVCYTNLAPDFLATLGVPTNRIATAKARAERLSAYNATLTTNTDNADQQFRTRWEAWMKERRRQELLRAIDDYRSGRATGLGYDGNLTTMSPYPSKLAAQRVQELEQQFKKEFGEMPQRLSPIEQQYQKEFGSNAPVTRPVHTPYGVEWPNSKQP